MKLQAELELGDCRETQIKIIEKGVSFIQLQNAGSLVMTVETSQVDLHRHYF